MLCCDNTYSCGNQCLMAIYMTLQLPWLCRLCMLMLRCGMRGPGFILIMILAMDAYAAADSKKDADSEDVLHLPSTRTVICAHVRVSWVGKGNAPVAPAYNACKAFASCMSCRLPLAVTSNW